MFSGSSQLITTMASVDIVSESFPTPTHEDIACYAIRVPSERSAFLAACEPCVAEALGKESGLDDCLRAMVASARTRWADLEVEPARFAAYVASRLDGSAPRLADVHADDLYLACGCADGDPKALALFERDFIPEVDAVLAKHRIALDREEFRQAMREHLLVAAQGGHPRVSMYRGRGSLKNWVRVAALRTALNRVRAADARPALVSDEHVLEQISALLVAPEIEPFRGEYEAVFKGAFEDALCSLSAGQRLMLRYQLVDGYTLEEVGRLSNVSRATAARRLRATKDELLESTRTLLSERLKMDASEANAVIRLVLSRVDVTLSRVL